MEAAAAAQGPFAVARFGAAAVGVAGDHVAAVDPEPGRHLDSRVDAAAEDRLGGDVGGELGAEQAVDAGDEGRERGADGATGQLLASAAAAVVAGERLPGRLGGVAGTPVAAAAALGDAVAESIYRGEHPLVIGGGGSGWQRPGGAHHRGGGDALRPRQRQMGVDVVAVGGVDVIAQPDAGVGEGEARRRQPLGEPLGRAGGGVEAVLEPERGSVEREPVQQRLGEAVVVVARDEARLAPGERLTEPAEEGPGRVEREPEGEVAQLDRVAEQDDAIGGGELRQQHLGDRGGAQDVVADGAAEVQVGDDRRPHRCSFYLHSRNAVER